MVRLKPFHVAVIVPVVFVVGIGGSMLLNWWITESTKLPRSFSSGEFAGEYNPADIRGSYSFADIESAFGIPVDVLAQAFGVTDTLDPSGFQAKSLEEMYVVQPDGGEVGTDALRYFVSLYTGLPYLPEESTRLPSPAVGVLSERLSTADLAVVRQRIVPIGDLLSLVEEHGAVEEPAATEATTVVADEHAEDGLVVNGTTTFGVLLDWGLSREQIEEVLGGEMGSRLEKVRDYATEQGVEFSTLKSAFQALLESTGDDVRE